tara:strand:- start:687 stop:959 length:273 start_codon:yes stop_codon:yes gene_type:complete
MYQVKNIKLFDGREGTGFNATLYRGNTKVAKVVDDASGREVSFNWIDNQEESLFRTYCLSLPKWDCEGKMVHTNMDIAVTDLVNNTLDSK